MANFEKLVKAIDALKLQPSTEDIFSKKKDSLVNKKDKIASCHAVVECICTSTNKQGTDLSKFWSVAFETLLALCDDADSDVRIVADECLNKIINNLLDVNVSRIQVELYKEIKKNGPSRCVRAALVRFADMCHFIKPQKCRPYVQSLLPCLAKLSERPEETIQDTLLTSLQKLCPVLIGFCTETEVKHFVGAFLPGLANTSASTRRSSAGAISVICQNTRSPVTFTLWLLQTLIAKLIPLDEERSIHHILGVLLALRHLIPVLTNGKGADEGTLRGSFGVTRSAESVTLQPERFIQIFELCLFFTNHSDHNVVTGSLETLQQFLRSAPADVIDVLCRSGGLVRSTVSGEGLLQFDTEKLASRLPSVASELDLEDHSEAANRPSEPHLRVNGAEDEDLPESEVVDGGYAAESSDSSEYGPDEETKEHLAEADQELQEQDATNENDDAFVATEEKNHRRTLSDELSDPTQLPEDNMRLEIKATDDVTDIVRREGDIGSLFDADSSPLLHTARHLAAKFLLSGFQQGLLSDSIVRVSVKSLALGCVTSLIAVDTSILNMELHKSSPAQGELQTLKDVLLYVSHCDPQLKGLAAMLLGNIVHSTLVTGADATAEFDIPELVRLLLTILVDESSMAAKQAIVALKLCLSDVISHGHTESACQALTSLAKLKTNPYWLVKVELADLIGSLDFTIVGTLASSSTSFGEFQETLLEEVLLYLLGDDDMRVRNAVATTLTRFVDNSVYLPNETSMSEAIATACLKRLLRDSFDSDETRDRMLVEDRLSRLLALVYERLNQSDSRNVTLGCVRALTALSEVFPAITYPNAWGVSLPSTLTAEGQTGRASVGRSLSTSSTARLVQTSYGSTMSIEELLSGSGGGCLPRIVSYLTSSPLMTDLTSHIDILQLAANIFSGAANECLRSSSYDAESEQRWFCLADRTLVPMADELLTHVSRLLSIYSHVIEDIPPISSAIKPPNLPSLPQAPSLSPIKRKGKSAKEEKKDEKSQQDAAKTAKQEKREKEAKSERFKNGIGSFSLYPHYLKLYDVLKAAHNNSKLVLDFTGVDRFNVLLRTCLTAVAKILDFASISEVEKVTEELLFYLRAAMQFEPTDTIKCLQQLLKALFGTNNASNGGHSSSNSADDVTSGIYHQCLIYPYLRLVDDLKLAAAKFNQPEFEVLASVRELSERKVPAILSANSKTDKNTISAYIRLFEPLVIRSLKQYTVSSSIQLQCQVLDLLIELVQLRVNYCLLDSDQIFIGFVIKQFELMEEGQMRESEVLVPHIFNFLVLLSYERYHTKSIIAIPKIIQLCDGMMASGRQPAFHGNEHGLVVILDLGDAAIPALRPIVQDLFVLRAANVADVADLNAQREVVVSMLLRLLRHRQVQEMLVIVLQQSRHDDPDRWRSLSRVIADTILSLFCDQEMALKDMTSLKVVHRLFENLSGVVFRPLDIFFKALFNQPKDLSHSACQWMASVVILTRVMLYQLKEEALFVRLKDLSLTLPYDLEGGKFHGNEEPQATIGSFLLQTVAMAGRQLKERLYSLLYADANDFLSQLLCHLLLHITHILQSGDFPFIAAELRQSCCHDNERTGSAYYSIDELNSIMLSIGGRLPSIGLLWCHIMVQLGYQNRAFWQGITESSSHCPNYKVLRDGAILSVCELSRQQPQDVELVTWLVCNHVSDLVTLSAEPPVRRLFSEICLNPSASELFLQAVSTSNELENTATFCRRLLRCLEKLNVSQSGHLLTWLVRRQLHTFRLALARQCETVCCLRVETLLTFETEEIGKQLPLEQISDLIVYMRQSKKRFPRLFNLLKKLRSQLDETVSTTSEEENLLEQNVPDIEDRPMDHEMLLSLVRSLCYSSDCSAKLCAKMLIRLDYSSVLSVLMAQELRLQVIPECISLGVELLANQQTASDGEQTPAECLLQAALSALWRKLGHAVVEFPPNFADHQLKDVFNSVSWRETASALCDALRIIICPDQLNAISESSTADLLRLVVTLLQYLNWTLSNDNNLSSSRFERLLFCTASLISYPPVHVLIGQSVENPGWMNEIITAVHGIMGKVLGMTKLEMEELCKIETEEDSPVKDSVSQSCVKVSEMIECLNLDSFQAKRQLKSCLSSLVISLGRLPLVNSYVRVPPIVWRLGWNVDVAKQPLPPPPLDMLQDRDVLLQYIYRITLLGWTNRQQFEETWMCLLGLLNPVSLGNENTVLTPEEDQERALASVLSVRCITTLLVQSLLWPEPGNPGNSHFEHKPRRSYIPFLHSRKKWKIDERKVVNGRKFNAIKHIIQFKIRHLESDGKFNMQLGAEIDMERTLQDTYGPGQLSVEALWGYIGMLDPKKYLPRSPDSDGSDAAQELFPPYAAVTLPIDTYERSVVRVGLDLNSCLQFLLELYGQQLAPGATPRTPLMLLNEIVRSAVILSDVFTDRIQFDWMLQTLLEVYRTHSSEDELLLSYTIIGLCKAAAVTGPDIPTTEKVLRILENHLKSNHVPTKLSCLQGALYLLQSKVTEINAQLVPLLIGQLHKHLFSTSYNLVNIASEKHVCVLWAVAFYIAEHNHDFVSGSDFVSQLVKLAVCTLERTEEDVLTALYDVIMSGLERLQLSGNLAASETDMVLKLCVTRVCLQDTHRCFVALVTLLACMYTGKDKGKENARWSPAPIRGEADDVIEDPEVLIVAQERVYLLIERIRKGYPDEAKVLTAVLPPFFCDFFPAQDIMNKVIGEFISAQQPHPNLFAEVLFDVFDYLLACNQQSIVRDWVMLSLSNCTQREPVAMALWSLTVLFTASSFNINLRNMFPFLLGRMGRLETLDRQLFLASGSDFWSGLSDHTQRRVFRSTFTSLTYDPCYAHLLELCGSVDY